MAWRRPGFIVNWTLRNKLLWNLNRYSNIFIQENAFESVVCETAAILSRPQCVNKMIWKVNILQRVPQELDVRYYRLKSMVYSYSSVITGDICLEDWMYAWFIVHNYKLIVFASVLESWIFSFWRKNSLWWQNAKRNTSVILRGSVFVTFAVQSNR